jgi:hypothetical protein
VFANVHHTPEGKRILVSVILTPTDTQLARGELNEYELLEIAHGIADEFMHRLAVRITEHRASTRGREFDTLRTRIPARQLPPCAPRQLPPG